MLVESSVRFFCAESMTASRSCSLAIESVVLRAVSVKSEPTRWVMRSSRSLTARASSPWRVTLISARVCSRPFELGKLAVALARLPPPPPHMQGDDRHQHDEGERHEPEQSEQNQHRVERKAPHLEGVEMHGMKL